MAEQTGVIERDMAETREALGEKVGALEEKVVDTVKDTAAAVSDTVGAVKETVQQTTQAVADTVESVKDSLDISAQVRNHPWLMVGGGLALGFALNLLLNPGQKSTPSSARSRRPARQEGSWTDSLGSVWDSVAPVADKLKGLALGATSGVLGEVLLQYAPQSLKNGLSDLVNSLTEQMGGTILRPKQHHDQQPQQSQPEQHQHRETRTI